MNTLQSILFQPLTEKLGWTLIHFIWQGAAAAILLALLLRILRKSSANARYLVTCIGLVLIILLPIITFQLIDTAGIYIETEPISAVEPLVDLPSKPAAEVEVPMVEVAKLIESPKPLPAVPFTGRMVSAIQVGLPYIVLGWLLGVFALSLYHLGGWTQLQRLRGRMVRQVSERVRLRLEYLADRIGVKRVVDIMESAMVQVPTVVGHLKPAILLPASALTSLTTQQLEAILAHELAHIKRCDYLVNIFQTIVEILGFYHPAVWWVSAKIRAERENCCDDLAVKITGNRLHYAKALASMEEIRSAGPKLAVAASSGYLLNRIRRLFGIDCDEKKRFSWLPAVMAILIIISLLIPVALAMRSKPKPDTEASKIPYNRLMELTDIATKKPTVQTEVEKHDIQNNSMYGGISNPEANAVTGGIKSGGFVFSTGKDGITFIRYDGVNFNTGWAGINSELEQKEFTIKIQSDLNAKFIPKETHLVQPIVINTSKSAWPSSDIVQDKLQSLLEKQKTEGISVVIIETPMPKFYLVRLIWREMLIQEKKDIVFIFSSKLNTEPLRQMARNNPAEQIEIKETTNTRQKTQSAERITATENTDNNKNLVETGQQDQSERIRNIIERVESKYASMQTYQSKGETISEVLIQDKTEGSFARPQKFHSLFSVKLNRDGKYCIEWSQKVNVAFTGTGATWSIGGPDWLLSVGEKERMKNRDMALGAAAGISNSATQTIPTIFFGEQIPLFNDLRFEPDEEINGNDCYVISGRMDDFTHIYWISKETYLIYQARLISQNIQLPEDTSKDIPAELNSMSFEKIIMTQTYEDIVINEPISDKQFVPNGLREPVAQPTVQGEEKDVWGKAAIPNILTSLKTRLVEMSSIYPELVGARDIHIEGVLGNTLLYGLDYYHNCKYWGKRGYEDTGPHSAHIEFKISKRPENGNNFSFQTQAPSEIWPNLDLVGWAHIYVGKNASPGFEDQIREVLQQHIDMINELDQSVKTNVQVEGKEKKQLTPWWHASSEQTNDQHQAEKYKKRMESAKKLSGLGKVMLIYANQNEEKYPNALQELKSYIQDANDFNWLVENIEYLGNKVDITNRPYAILAYDKTILKEGKGTNVLYNDAHVSFEKSEKLRKLGIDIDLIAQVDEQLQGDPIIIDLDRQIAEQKLLLIEEKSKPDIDQYKVRTINQLLNAFNQEREKRKAEITEQIRRANLKTEQTKTQIDVEARLLLVPLDSNEIKNFFELENIPAGAININNDPNKKSYFLNNEQCDRLLEIAKTQPDCKVIATPRARAFNGEEVTFRQQKMIRYSIPVSDSNQPQEKDLPVGIVFTVKPTLQLNSENIMLDVYFEYTNLLGFEEGLPSTEITSVKSRICLPDNIWLIMSELANVTRKENDQQVPKNLVLLIKAKKLEQIEPAN